MMTRGRPQCQDAPGSWHSQDGQDKTVAKLLQFQYGGFFVDLAANQPVCLSNTRALERDYGWRGLCIEPNSELLLPLVKQRNCTVVGAVVSSQEEVVVFRRFMSLASVGKGDKVATDNKYPDWYVASADRSVSGLIHALSPTLPITYGSGKTIEIEWSMQNTNPQIVLHMHSLHSPNSLFLFYPTPFFHTRLYSPFMQGAGPVRHRGLIETAPPPEANRVREDAYGPSGKDPAASPCSSGKIPV